ncbi:gamma-butyrobetaine hydroxylase-like domain-containing protein [Rhodopila sp.]|uniref:gamma-butyrobetaine hydroxylase-like domain-containing protein n=1 Tax=Rhodopila sp. TaxID=2480087 RepID=UPI003D141CEE
MVIPTEIRLDRATSVLHVTFDDGTACALPTELLRVESPSAEVQGHNPAQKQILAGRRHVGIIGIEPVGHYAVRLLFDDLHDTGIYTWDYLWEMGQNKDALWAAYLDALASRGLSRDPK